MCKFTYLAFFYYAPFFVLQYPLTVCIEPLNFTLPSSKVQANCKQENSQKKHTLTLCIFLPINKKCCVKFGFDTAFFYISFCFARRLK